MIILNYYSLYLENYEEAAETMARSSVNKKYLMSFERFRTKYREQPDVTNEFFFGYLYRRRCTTINVTNVTKEERWFEGSAVHITPWMCVYVCLYMCAESSPQSITQETWEWELGWRSLCLWRKWTSANTVVIRQRVYHIEYDPSFMSVTVNFFLPEPLICSHPFPLDLTWYSKSNWEKSPSVIDNLSYLWNLYSHRISKSNDDVQEREQTVYLWFCSHSDLSIRL